MNQEGVIVLLQSAGVFLFLTLSAQEWFGYHSESENCKAQRKREGRESVSSRAHQT